MKFQAKEIGALLKLELSKNDKIKFSEESILLTSDFLEIFVNEAISRMQEIANEEEINLNHLEKILPQLLLDFF